jgi:hypothetical protein
MSLGSSSGSAGQFEFSSQPFTTTSATQSNTLPSSTVTWYTYDDPYTKTTDHTNSWPRQPNDMYIPSMRQDWPSPPGRPNSPTLQEMIRPVVVKESCREDMVIMDDNPKGSPS